MPIEFLHGLPLGPEELQIIRRQIEAGVDVIGAVDDEIRGIVARTCYPSFRRKRTDAAGFAKSRR
jgi:hypothetical protein